MKKFIVLLLFFNLSIFAQENIEYLNTVDHAPILDNCLLKDKHDKMCFVNSLKEYISNKLILPFDSLNNPVEGKVKAYLIFTKDGTLKIKAIRSKKDILRKQSESLFENFPPFKPAIKNDSSVTMAFVFPISYVFSTNPNKFYSINEVLPPQIKIYRSKKTPYELHKKYLEFINNFIIKANEKGHYISKNHYGLSFSFEIDTLGRMGNFKDLIKPNSSYEKYFNKRALKKGNAFLIPAKIGNRSVKIKDSIQLMGVVREVKRTMISPDNMRY